MPIFSGLGLCCRKGKAPSHGTARFRPCPSRPRPPAGVNPQKCIWRWLRQERGQDGKESPARAMAGRESAAPGENGANSEVWGGGDHAAPRGARGPEGAAERRRAHTALPAEPRPPPPALASHLVRTCRRGGAADAIPTMLRGVPPPPSLPPPLPLVEEDGGRRSGGPGHPAF